MDEKSWTKTAWTKTGRRDCIIGAKKFRFRFSVKLGRSKKHFLSWCLFVHFLPSGAKSIGKGNYNPNMVWINQIPKRFLCVKYRFRSSNFIEDKYFCRQIFSESCWSKANLDRNHTFKINLVPKGIPFDIKSIEKVELQSKFGSD